MTSIEINHHPYLDTDKVCKLYSEKDGVPIKYVCTSALGGEEFARDIFYRDTPHPEFGNRYFALWYHYDIWTTNKALMISSADKVEELTFDMVEYNGKWEYSQHRHDYRQLGAVSIDGGRAYTRLVGNTSVPVKTFRVKDGDFVL